MLSSYGIITCKSALQPIMAVSHILSSDTCIAGVPFLFFRLYSYFNMSCAYYVNVLTVAVATNNNFTT